MNNNERTKMRKLLSYVLRHRPDEIGIKLDCVDWVSVNVLLIQAAERG